MTRHIAVSEFKDKASEIIAAAEAGEEIVITRHGKPAARLLAIEDDEARKTRARAAMDALMRHRERMRAQGRTATVEEIIAWKNEGRR